MFILARIGKGRNVCDDIARRLTDWAEQAQAQAAKCQNEEQTKLAIIIPFFEALGYQSQNLAAMDYEVNSGMADVRPGRADLCIRDDDDEVVVVVECKTFDSTMDNDLAQLKRYANAHKTAPLALLTNGRTFRFYTRQNGSGSKLNDEPLTTLTLESIAASDVKGDDAGILKAISRRHFSPDSIQDFVDRRNFDRKARDWWTKQMRSPSDELVTLVLKSSGYERVTDKLRKSYGPLVLEPLLFAMAGKVKTLLENGETDVHGTYRPGESSGNYFTEQELALFNEAVIQILVGTKGQIDFETASLIAFADHDSFFTIYWKQVNKGRIVRCYDVGHRDERFEFEDGQVVTDRAQLREPLVRNFLNAVRKRAG